MLPNIAEPLSVQLGIQAALLEVMLKFSVPPVLGILLEVAIGKDESMLQPPVMFMLQEHSP